MTKLRKLEDKLRALERRQADRNRLEEEILRGLLENQEQLVARLQEVITMAERAQS